MKSIVSCSILRKLLQVFFFAFVFALSNTLCYGQYRPGLFFREDWKEIPAATPVTQEHVANNDLILGLYGPGCDSIRKSHHDSPSDDPYYIWSGLCKGNWAVTLRSKSSYVDLSKFSKVIWRSRQSGFRCLHLILKLADGTWLVSNLSDCLSHDWRVFEINLMDVSWYILNIKSVIEVRPISNPDLSKVDEIGFTDLMSGGVSNACSRLDWIEVYGNPVPR